MEVDFNGMDPEIYRVRHSLAHVLAQAVLAVRPTAKLGFGPPIKTGFYYDFMLDEPLKEADLKGIAKRMKKIIKQGQPFERSDGDAEAARQKLAELDQSFKVEQVNDLENRGEKDFSFYANGPFIDLCEGPHVESTKDLPLDCWKLDSLAGAYWKGSENNPMMQRVYGLAFETKDALERFIEMRKLQAERDHRKLGKEMELFTISSWVGKGLPLWLPGGAAIREELEKLAREEEFKAGYHRIVTPQLAKDKLYERSGHLAHYEDSMYPPMVESDDDESNEEEGVEGTRYFLRPMNCPHHHLVYESAKRSYRDLPLRLAEFGNCYRFEKSGDLSGLVRVRGMTQNDAHIYCTEEQVRDEIASLLDLHSYYYELFGLEKIWVRLSLGDPDDTAKYVVDPEQWARAEQLLRDVLTEKGVEFKEVSGEAAFYGPKIDFQATNAIDREETLSTIQVDFTSPKKFELEYTGADNEPHRPIIIHRAPLGTHERFASFLIEHYGGAFPTWLAPVQVRLVPIGEGVFDYAKEVEAALRARFIRTEVDWSSDSFNKKVRKAAMSKAPNFLILGGREAEDRAVAHRRYGTRKQDVLALDDFVALMVKEIGERQTWRPEPEPSA